MLTTEQTRRKDKLESLMHYAKNLLYMYHFDEPTRTELEKDLEAVIAEWINLERQENIL